MSAHTPEVWHVGAQNDVLYIIDAAPRPAPFDGPIPQVHGGNVIAKVYGDDLSVAHRLAAAPDLLTALKALLERYHVMGCGDGPEALAARAAIAKAEGRQP